MHILKRHKLLIMLATAVHLLSACNKEKQEDVKKDFTLAARVQSLDYGGTSIWGTEAELGVFVTKPGTQDVTEENFNLKYRTTFQTKATRLEATDDKMNLPDNEEQVDIALYYPYNPELSSKENRKTIYDVDLKNQNARIPDILLVGMENGCNTTINSATITLRPVFAKLNVRLKNNITTKSSTEDIKIELVNIPCKSEIDVLTGEYLSYGTLESTEMMKPLENIYAYEAILLAHKLDKNAILRVIFSNSADLETMEIPLREHMREIKQNLQYDLGVTVSPEGIKATLVSMSEFSISDWYEDMEDIYGNIKN